MDNYVNKCLFDMLNSIDEINGYFANNRTYEFYSSNRIVQRAVERNLEIIGEAMNRILKIDKSMPILNAKEIIDTRNKISHGYDQVNHAIIWGIVIKHLPVLKSEIEKYIPDRNEAIPKKEQLNL